MKTTVAVRVRDNNVHEALRKLRKKCERNGVVTDMKRRVAYIKPSQQKRIDAARSKIRRRKREEG